MSNVLTGRSLADPTKAEVLAAFEEVAVGLGWEFLGHRRHWIYGVGVMGLAATPPDWVFPVVVPDEPLSCVGDSTWLSVRCGMVYDNYQGMWGNERRLEELLQGIRRFGRTDYAHEIVRQTGATFRWNGTDWCSVWFGDSVVANVVAEFPTTEKDVVDTFRMLLTGKRRQTC